MWAALPVPRVTTWVSMAVICCAVLVDTTRRGGGVGAPSTSLGATYMPPLAIVLYTSSIWRAVTATPWPIGTVAIDAPDQFLGSGSSPADSPGKWSAVFWP